MDFLIDDYPSLSVLPIEVKSGKDCKIHSALTSFTKNGDYHVKNGIVLSNSGGVETGDKILFLPIYYAMFL